MLVFRMCGDCITNGFSNILNVTTVQSTHINPSIFQQVDVILAGEIFNLSG